MFRIRRIHLRTTLAILFSVALTMMFAWPSLTFAASQPQFPVPPPLPSQTASVATWAGWASQQRAATQSADWTALLSTAQCTVHQATIVPTTSNGSGSIPAGVVTDAVEVTGYCAGNTGSSSTMNATSAAALPSACPGTLTNSKTQAATDGTICVGYYELAWAGAGYYFTGSGSVTGHVELGNGYGKWPGGACQAGTDYTNGTEITLSQSGDYTQYITYGGAITYDTEITGTWWEGSTFNNWGTVCSTFY